MIGKKQKRIREGLSAASLLFVAAKNGDQDRILGLMTGPDTTEDGIAQALMLFWGVAAEVPSVRARLEEIADEIDPKVRQAFTTSFLAIDSGNKDAFRPETASAQMTFIAVIVKVIADDPEGERLLRQTLGLS